LIISIKSNKNQNETNGKGCKESTQALASLVGDFIRFGTFGGTKGDEEMVNLVGEVCLSASWVEFESSDNESDDLLGGWIGDDFGIDEEISIEGFLEAGVGDNFLVCAVGCLNSLLNECKTDKFNLEMF